MRLNIPAVLKFIYLLFTFLLIFLAACQPNPAARTTHGTPSPTPLSRYTPTPTGSPTMAPTPVPPTKTILPTRPPTASPTPTNTPTPALTRILFTGNIVPARCVQAKIDVLGNPNYPYEEVQVLIAGVDLAIGTLNATISDVTVPTGCVDTFLLVGRAQNAAALAWAGFDAMSVATNHIKNCGVSRCGDQAFFDTLENLQQAGIRPIGAGRDLAEALQPEVFTVHGIRFAIVSLGEIEASAFATGDSPGIAVLTEDNLRAALAVAQNQGDVVIAMPHWGPEYSNTPNYRQLHFARIAVDAGADLVVGNHTHTVQAIESIDGVPVFYGLGNFMFDQAWSRPTQQGVALIVTFEETRFLSYELFPVHIDGDGRIHLAESQEAADILGTIEAASQALP